MQLAGASSLLTIATFHGFINLFDDHRRSILRSLDYDNVVEDPDVVERIFDDVGNIDYIYQVIQECVDEVTEEQYMNYQQELEEVAT